jgi:predicted nicotinamide N-methyase
MALILPLWRPALDEPTGDVDLTWAYPWPAGERLAADLPELGTWTGMRVAELGCGRGRSGLTLLTLGAASCSFADLAPEPLAYVRAALVANQLELRGSTMLHAWGNPLPGGPFQLIVGADILYRPAFHARLLTSIATSLARNGRCLLADPRSELEPELPDLAASLGLTWQTTRRPGPYTLVSLEFQPRA